MINQIQKIIYVHPPKTGGWSIINIFGGSSSIPGQDWGTDGLPLHHTLKFYYDKGYNLDHYFIFSTARNPWKRVVSAYYWLTHFGGFRMPMYKNVKPHKGYSFVDYVKWLADDRVYITHSSDNSFWSHPCPIMDFISVNGIVKVDCICEIETYERDFKFVTDTIQKNPKLPHVNKTNHDDFKSYYDEKSIDIVAKVFRSDIEYFKYKFDDLNYSDYERVIDQKKIDEYKKNRRFLMHGCKKL